MERNHIDYFDGPGGAAFYAPKMDLMARDALGREWQLSTIQIDYVMPQRFNLSYTDSDGKAKSPIMLHRAILGSSERFLMILIEHFAGAFPLWLSPVQVSVLPISEKFLDYARSIQSRLSEAGIRVELDDSNESLGKKIRNAQGQKTPLMFIVGAKEEENGTVSVRTRDGVDLGAKDLEEIKRCIQQNISQKSLDLLK